MFTYLFHVIYLFIFTYFLKEIREKIFLKMVLQYFQCKLLLMIIQVIIKMKNVTSKGNCYTTTPSSLYICIQFADRYLFI